MTTCLKKKLLGMLFVFLLLLFKVVHSFPLISNSGTLLTGKYLSELHCVSFFGDGLNNAGNMTYFAAHFSLEIFIFIPPNYFQCFNFIIPFYK